jgi:hypothetical protein
VERVIGVVVIVHIDTKFFLPDFTRRHIILVIREISFRNKYLLNISLRTMHLVFNTFICYRVFLTAFPHFHTHEACFSTKAVVYCMWWPLYEACNHKNVNKNDSIVVIRVYICISMPHTLLRCSLLRNKDYILT